MPPNPTVKYKKERARKVMIQQYEKVSIVNNLPVVVFINVIAGVRCYEESGHSRIQEKNWAHYMAHLKVFRNPLHKTTEF